MFSPILDKNVEEFGSSPGLLFKLSTQVILFSNEAMNCYHIDLMIF